MYSHRRATKEDFEVIAGFPQDPLELFFISPKATYPLTANQLEEVANKRFNPLVITKGETVVGYANLYDISDDECWLGNFIIKPSYRGRGVGRYLIKTMGDYARKELGVKYLRLICQNSNTKGLLFYLKLGFKPFDMLVMEDISGNNMVGIKLQIEV